MSMHSMRSGAVSRPRASWSLLQRGRAGGQVAGAAELVLGEGFGGVAGHRFHQRALVASLRDAQGHARAAQLGQQVLQRRGVVRAAPGPATSRGVFSVVVAVELHDELVDQPRRRRRSSTLSSTQPRWPRTRPPRTWKTWTETSSSSCANAITSASVPSPSTTACFSIARRSAPRSSRRRAARSNSSSSDAGQHLAFQAADHVVGLAREEVAEVLDDVAVLVRGHLAHARRRALVDVAEQARAADLAVPLENARRAGARGEHAQQQVERLADGPGVRERAEVAHALLARAAVDVQPRVVLVQRDGQHRVRLVVAVPDVEPRVELLDPVVLELQRLDLGGDDRPLDGGRRRHHLAGARVQPGQIGEVGVQPAAQALRLADVHDPATGVAELVDAGSLRNRAHGGAIRRGICHAVKTIDVV